MSTALSSLRHTTERRTPLIGFALLALVALPVLATTADRNAPINVKADHFTATQGSGTTVLSGHVGVTQGTLQAAADKATAYRNDAGDFNRIVLEGAPATLQQSLDDGATMHGAAQNIDYAISADTVTLTGAAHVERSDQGSFAGARLVYNTATGAIEGTGGTGGQVQLVLKPRTAGSH